MRVTEHKFLHKAKSYLMGLIDSEKNDWDALTTIYIRKYKTDQDCKAKERAWAEAATIKQRKDESVKASGERAVRLPQLVASDEGYLVRCFLAGMKDTALWQTLVSGYDDMTSVTVKDLNKKIQNIVGASSQHDVDSSDDKEEAADGDSSDDEVAAKPRITRAKLLRASSDAATICDLEERLRRMELGSAAAEDLAVTNGKENVGNQQLPPQWGGYGRPRQQGRSYQQYLNAP